MKTYPLVTIGVLCYNTGRLVVESMECIPKQQYPNLEIIIVDDCSTDGISAGLIQKYIDTQQLNCVFIRNKENKGISRNMNYIIDKASPESKYLTFLCDDLWDDNFLNTLVEILEQSNENEIFVYSDVRMMDYNTKEITGITDSIAIHPNSENAQRLFSRNKGSLYTLYNKEFIEFLFETNPIYPIGMLHKTSLLKKEGGFCTNYFFEDYPTWFKFAKLGYDFLYYHEALTRYVRHGNNISILRNIEIKKVNGQLIIENISYCNRIYTLKKIVPQIIYNYDTAGWFSFIKIKFIIQLISKNKKIVFALISNSIDKIFKIKRSY